MTPNRDDRAPLRGEDEEFVERLAEGFAPAALSPARRAAFDEALAVRIAGRRRKRLLVPALAAAAAAVALAWLVAPGARGPVTNELAGEKDLLAEAEAAARWERELFDPGSLFESEEAADSEQLPDDYAAIAGAFLDG
jgi:hypothetical protein